MSKCAKLSNEWLFFFGILAGYALLGLFLIVPGLLATLAGSLLLFALAVILVITIVLFALAIIFKGLSRLFHIRKHK
ncbi:MULTISPECIES: hypothetical protein [unclassified Sporosarcina]|uniref:hypothetical protein n=1 Tax=unclassified Sporosarcina TaxID=2647733 RepID=UPI000C1725E6|nr:MULTISPECIES: hypothetical protein [unclassified Sporosarcina]PID13918.1 hypothetical protein CSV63_15515 [Sporosarcina sp. P34]PID23617.1 hypothetical protein CSV60_13950 [Sporosarcina sp. P7]